MEIDAREIGDVGGHGAEGSHRSRYAPQAPAGAVVPPAHGHGPTRGLWRGEGAAPDKGIMPTPLPTRIGLESIVSKRVHGSAERPPR